MSIESNNKIILKAAAKINLHLEVLGKREDKYHELSMIMQSIDLYDFLEIENNNSGILTLNSECKNLPLNENNLILKTALLLREVSGNNELGANIFLTKNIPIGAGLAGGSSNAAATLIGLNKLWKLNLNSRILHELAINIGSDVPFCLDGGFQFCFGKGEILEKKSFNSNYGLILIKDPNVSISTAEIYRKYSKRFCNNNLLDVDFINERRNFLRLNGIHNAKNIRLFSIKNDLQKIAEEENQSVRDGLSILSRFEECLFYSMSGSGPSCFAIFENQELANRCYKKNIKSINENNFDAWVCKFVNEGIKIL